MRGITYRPAQGGDFEAMYAIEAASFVPPVLFTRRYLRGLVENASNTAWVAEADGAIAGFALVEIHREGEQPVAYLQTIEVAPERRGKGMGAGLLSCCEKTAEAAQAAAIELHVDIENGAAIRLYESRGYSLKGVAQDFYAPGRDARVYAKSLQSGGKNNP